MNQRVIASKPGELNLNGRPEHGGILPRRNTKNPSAWDMLLCGEEMPA